MQTLVIGINYRTEDCAVKFARSLSNCGSEDLTVLLVDNSESPDPRQFVDRLRKANPQIRYLVAPRNLGYFGGANYALNRCSKAGEPPDWVVVCNVDIEFKDRNFFGLLRELNLPEGAAVVAPRIWSARWKRDLNPKINERPTRQRMAFYKIIFDNYYYQLAYEMLSFLKNAWRSAVRSMQAQPAEPNPPGSNVSAFIYAPHGSCMVFRRTYFDAGGNFNYSAFLFGEEIFVAETARRLGLGVIHCPSLVVFDSEHASTGIVRSRKIAGYMKEATNHLIEHYFP
jgi:GT2 family glycosyltransferase